jgi:hypothetical protein
MTSHRVFDKLHGVQESVGLDGKITEPLFFRLSSVTDCDRLDELLTTDSRITIYDQLLRQLQELIKNRFAERTFTVAQIEEAVSQHLNGIPEREYGVWVFYPWSLRLVHLLDENEFIELRTCRNMYKITAAERDELSTKKIGIIGLSVGQTIAMALAMERLCGELRIADFDTLDLGNLNRLRAGVHELALPKTALAARSIHEIDPFIRVICIPEGINFDNMEDFLLKGGKLDILVEESDSIDMKIFSRMSAKTHGVAVVMDTNDRGMLDVERYDLNPALPLLHGLIGDLDPRNLSNLNREELIKYMSAIVGYENVSARMKISAGEIGKTITSWPQLASSVLLGGGMIADTCRRILLNEFNASGRFYVDFEKIIQ